MHILIYCHFFNVIFRHAENTGSKNGGLKQHGFSTGQRWRRWRRRRNAGLAVSENCGHFDPRERVLSLTVFFPPVPARVRTA